MQLVSLVFNSVVNYYSRYSSYQKSKNTRVKYLLKSSAFFLATISLSLALPLIKANQENLVHAQASSSTNAHDIMGLDATTVQYFNSLAPKSGEQKVQIAAIGTGVDLNNSKIKEILAKDLGGTVQLASQPAGSNLQDTDGMGTQVASLLTDPRIPFRNILELLPIKVSETYKAMDLSAINRGVKRAQNSNAAVVYIPSAYPLAIGKPGSPFTAGCSPTSGHTFYLLRERGIAGVTSAGEGPESADGQFHGIPIEAAQEHVPGRYNTTHTYGCWGMYFQGLLSVAGMDRPGTAIPDQFNYSNHIELSAPALRLNAFSLNNRATVVEGSNYAAMYVAVAMGLVEAHHKKHGFRTWPWLLEAIVRMSSFKDQKAAGFEKRVKDGARVDFKQLALVLQELAKITNEEDRLKIIQYYDENEGQGWKPGADRPDLADLALVLMLPENITPGITFQYEVVAFYHNSPPKIVTNDAGIRITISDSNLMQIDRQKATITLSGANKFLKPEEVLNVYARYFEDQAMVYDNSSFIVAQNANLGTLQSIKIAPPSILRILSKRVMFKAIGTYIDAKGNKQEKDITKLVKWSLNSSSGIFATPVPGTFDTMQARAGGKFTITASYKGVTSSYNGVLLNETLRRFFIHNPLGVGENGNMPVELGQKVRLESRFILDASSTASREVTTLAKWFHNGKAIDGGKEAEFQMIDTTGLSLGKHEFEARAVFRGVNSDQNVTHKVILTIGNATKYIELYTKETIIGWDAWANLRILAFRDNNSYEVITSKAELTVDRPSSEVEVYRDGRVYVKRNAKPGPFTVTAKYLEFVSKITLFVFPGSAVTGSSSQITDLSFDVPVDRLKTSCGFLHRPDVVTAHYKDGSSRTLTAYDIFFQIVDKQGNKRDLNPEAGKPLFMPGGTYALVINYLDTKGNYFSKAKTFTIPTDSNIYQLLPHAPYDDETKPVQFEQFANGQNRSIKLGASLRTNNIMAATCDLKIKNAAPQGLLYSGTQINIDQSKSGRYAITLAATSYASGIPVPVESTFDLILTPPKITPFTINIREIYDYPNKPGLTNRTTKLQYGKLHNLYIELLDENHRQQIFAKEDLDIQVQYNGKPYNSNLDRLFVGIIHENYGTRFSYFDYNNTYNNNIKILVSNKKNSKILPVTATIETIGSVRSTLAGAAPTRPSLTSPTPKSSMHPYCVATQNQTPEPIVGGGKGTDADPYIICTPNQLANIGKVMNQLQGQRILALGNNIDFKGNKVEQIQINSLRGEGYAIKNFTMVDREKHNCGLLMAAMSVSNLIIIDPVIRCGRGVAILAPVAYNLDNVTVIGGTVWGQSEVAAVAARLANLGGTNPKAGIASNVRVFGTQILYEVATGAGIGGVFASIEGQSYRSDSADIYSGRYIGAEASNLVFTGAIRPAGVLGSAMGPIGGISGKNEGIINNAIFKGVIFSLDSAIPYGTGGIAGLSNGVIMNSLTEGNIASTGAAVGGIVGKVDWSSAFGLDRKLQNLEADHNTRTTGLLNNRVKNTNLWGGMSREMLSCYTELEQIIGIGVSPGCRGGEVKSSSGGRSNVGGIVGLVERGIQIQDNSVENSTVIRGIKGVGGITGAEQGFSNYVNNSSAGLVSASDSASQAGTLIGFKQSMFGKVASRFEDNTVVARSGNPTWTIGTWDSRVQVNLTNNVPDLYDKSGATASNVQNSNLSWQNPKNRFDVNDDGRVSALDMLTVVNALNNGTTLTAANAGKKPFLDVNGDGKLTQQDAADIQSHINNK